jgi:outer membrane lipoprotein-sorting protein
VTSTISYTDYKDYKGIKFAYNLVMSMGRDIEVKISDIKINEDVSDADFE